MGDLNIWGGAVSENQLKTITKNCGKIHPTPDLLDWSNINISMITGRNGSDILTADDLSSPSTSPYISNIKITDICTYDRFTNHQCISVSLTQDEALHVCKSLKAELSFPNKTEKFWSKEGKFD